MSYEPHLFWYCFEAETLVQPTVCVNYVRVTTRWMPRPNHEACGHRLPTGQVIAKESYTATELLWATTHLDSNKAP